MSAPFVRLGAAGAVIDSRSPTLHLLGATVLPAGGQYCVDLLRPDQPYSLVLNADQLAETGPRDFAAALAETLQHDATLPEPPETWSRLALVAGLDRWFPYPLDEGLLAADRGLAQAEAGGTAAESAESFSTASESLARLVDRLRTRDEEAPEPHPAVLRAELLRVLRAGSQLVPELTPIWEDARYLRALRGAAATSTPQVRRPEPPPSLIRPPIIQLDPLRIPARLLRGPVDVERVGPGQWQVRCATFPAIDHQHPASHRLLLRALDPLTGELLALGPWVLDVSRGEFVSMLRIPSGGPPDVLIEPYDSWSSGAPRITPAERARVVLLERAQFAFAFVRDAVALAELGAEEEARAALVFASALAEGLPEAEAGHLTRIDSIVGAMTLDLGRLVGSRPSARPLLSELARAVETI